jgi:hypothetical protein
MLKPTPIIAIVIALISWQAAPGQVGNKCSQLNQVTTTCYANGCTQSVDVYYPVSTEYGEPVTLGYVGCCNAQVPSYYFGGSGCDIGALRKPEALRQVVNLAQNNSLLVANCRGVFREFVVPDLSHPHQSRNWDMSPLPLAIKN